MSQKDKNYLLLLIDKLFKGNISDTEVKNLSNFFVSHQKPHEWPFDIDDKRKYKESLYSKIELEITKRRLNNAKVVPLYKRNIFKYASAIVVFITVGYFYLTKDTQVENITPITANNLIEIGSDKAILTLEDGSNVILEKGQAYVSENVSGNGKEIVYNTKLKSTKNINYNYLTIPRGGQYFVKLSDGTQVWLNSDSKLKYPVQFVDGETRVVELLYGEAYFDVSPSDQHRNSKFKVFTGDHEIEVLGTEFNINAYKDESEIYTTLVEGKVSVNSGILHKQLIPGEQSKYNKKDNIINISKIDVYNEVSWKRGAFSFKGKPLKDIMNVLSRWYNFEVYFENKSLEKKTFGGVFSKDQRIEDILMLFENTNKISFEISGKTIIVK
ncbi:FecR family protein [Algibacter pacificus]|uniref:FecR family protein n=1 Tax=Algibacter pacificus TaxID=2599389 RepID=UPI0011C85AEB|nr:FecR domain-containing protein [Algibacter pacificus]